MDAIPSGLHILIFIYYFEFNKKENVKDTYLSLMWEGVVGAALRFFVL